MKSSLDWVRAVPLACLVFLVVPVMAGPRMVNCDAGESLQKAIEAGAGSARAVEIQLTGSCYENLTVGRDRIHILGDGSAVIHGRIRVFGSENVTFSDLEVTEPGDGIVMFDSRVRLLGVRLIGNPGRAISARQGSGVSLSDSIITGNGGEFAVYLESSAAVVNSTEVFENEMHGIGVHQNGTLTMNGGGVNNQYDGSGIVVSSSSSISLSSVHIGGNADIGVAITGASAAQFSDSWVNANATQGFDVSQNSSLEFAGGEVAWNGENGIYAYEHALVRLIDTFVQQNFVHGIHAASDSGIVVLGPTFVGNNLSGIDVICEGKEASFEAAEDAVIGPMDCADPDW